MRTEKGTGNRCFHRIWTGKQNYGGFCMSGSTIGIMFEKPSNGKRTATPGWYNTAAFEELAQEEGLYAKSINGDAFSAEVKQQAIDMIRADLGQVDMVIYSLAAPRRTTADNKTWSSTLKTTTGAFTEKSLGSEK